MGQYTLECSCEAPGNCALCSEAESWKLTVTGTFVDPDSSGLAGTFYLAAGPSSHYAACASDPCSYISPPIARTRAAEGHSLWKLFVEAADLTLVLVDPQTDVPCNESLISFTAVSRSDCLSKSFVITGLIDPADSVTAIAEPLS